MKRQILLLFLLISFGYAHSQETLVKGQLFGEAENEYLPYATISVSKDESMKNSIKKFATDDKGFFQTKLSVG